MTCNSPTFNPSTLEFYHYSVDEMIQILQAKKAGKWLYIWQGEYDSWTGISPDHPTQFNFADCIYSTERSTILRVDNEETTESNSSPNGHLEVDCHATNEQGSQGDNDSRAQYETDSDSFGLRRIMAGLDKQVFPKGHELHDIIIYDSDSRDYYNKKTDIFLSEDDIKFYKLRPLAEITSPLPKPLPENYFISGV